MQRPLSPAKDGVTTLSCPVSHPGSHWLVGLGISLEGCWDRVVGGLEAEFDGSSEPLRAEFVPCY